jgi:hypothetical protein
MDDKKASRVMATAQSAQARVSSWPVAKQEFARRISGRPSGKAEGTSAATASDNEGGSSQGKQLRKTD